MITVLFRTTRYSPPHATLDLRTDIDGWAAQPLPGVTRKPWAPGRGSWMSLVTARASRRSCTPPYGWQDDPGLDFAPSANGSTLPSAMGM